MKKSLLFFVLCSVGPYAEGQVLGRFYYDREWRLTRKDSSTYFRVSIFDTVNYTFAGAVRDFTKSGKIVMTGAYHAGVKEGDFVSYYPNGKVESSGKFDDGRRMGLWTFYYTDGKIKQEVDFKHDASFEIRSFNDSLGRQKVIAGIGLFRESGLNARNVPYAIEGNLKDGKRYGDWKGLLDGKLVFVETYNDNQLEEVKVANESGVLHAADRKPYVLFRLPIRLESTERLTTSEYITQEDYPFLHRILWPSERQIQHAAQNFQKRKTVEGTDKAFAAFSKLLGATPSRENQWIHFYYNKNWQISKKDSAAFYRVVGLDTTTGKFFGPVIDMRADGSVLMTGSYVIGEKSRRFTTYYPNGQIESQGSYVDNRRQGYWNYFYSSGLPKLGAEFSGFTDVKIHFYNDSTGQKQLVDGTGYYKEVTPSVLGEIYEGAFKNFERNGAWTLTSNGSILTREIFRNGTSVESWIPGDDGKLKKIAASMYRSLIPESHRLRITEGLWVSRGVTRHDYPFLKKLSFEPSTGEEVYTVVENSAVPECGMSGFYKAVFEEIRYPKEARRHGIEGKVFVEFVINTDGSLSEMQVLKGIGAGCDEEALRVINESQKKCKWVPGSQRGKPVKQRYTLPIIFKLG